MIRTIMLKKKTTKVLNCQLTILQIRLIYLYLWKLSKKMKDKREIKSYIFCFCLDNICNLENMEFLKFDDIN